MSSASVSKLFTPTTLGSIKLANRVVMAPLTRSRSTPEGLVQQHGVDYYTQRASAGMIITEGTQPSAIGQGYARTPGCHTEAQVAAWQAVTSSVKAQGGSIVLQIMHAGRITHPLNQHGVSISVAPSAIRAQGEMYTDQRGLLPFTTPHALSTAEVPTVVQEFVNCAQAAMKAGFDGVELHGANGYLIDQFLCTKTNQRTDKYGGSVANRIRFAVEVVEAVCAAIGTERVGLRLSPGHMFNDIGDEKPLETAGALLDVLPTAQMAYVHFMLPESFSPQLSSIGDHGALLPTMRKHVRGNLLAAGNYDRAKAEAAIESGLLQAAVFGRPFIANPDLVARLQRGLPLAEPRPELFYTPGEAGYSDYPPYAP